MNNHLYQQSLSRLTTRTALRLKHALLLFCALCASQAAIAQAPTSLQYPSPTVLITNVSTPYLSPTVSGNVASYGINPALPAGLSLNTSTGVISGMPTTASAAANYVVTATNASGATTDTLSLAVTSTHFSNNYDTIRFVNLPANITAIRGNGTGVGDSILYKNVASIGGQQIDCIVKTVSLVNGQFHQYDQDSLTGQYFTNNMSRFFSPQMKFTAAGSASFNFQFILGGTYKNADTPGIAVYLQKVRINTYDIDGNGGTNTNQYNEFSGFDTSELGSPTNIVPTYNATLGVTKFRSNTNANTSAVVADPTRVRLTYNNMSSFQLVVGADAGGAIGSTAALAYFFVDFSTGSAFATAVKTSAPSIDLNTTLPGVNNEGAACTGAINFTNGSGSANVGTPADPTFVNMEISFPTATIQDGASEQLIVNGATAGGTIALNANPSITNLTLGGIVYSVTGTTTANRRTLTFTRNTGTFVAANLEALLDALRYRNIAATPTSGTRVFTVNGRNAAMKSPDALLKATIACVAISGNIYHDVNGLTDATVNANGTQFGAAGAYAVLTNASTNAVITTQPIAAGGAFSFGRVDTGKYAIYVSNTATPGATVTAATYPAGGYQSTGEHLGAAAGSDGSADGKLSVTIGSFAVTGANFGIQIPPAATNASYSGIANPGGYNYYTVPNGGFNATDADGTVSSIVITGFPTGANYLKVGTAIYANPSGGVCPPQSACTVWPGSVTVAFADVNTISVDPASTANTSVVISFTAVDNGGLVSNNGVASSVTMNFIVPATPIAVSGNVWNDANASATKDAGEAFTSVANAGQSLYALLVQTSNTYSGAATIYSAATVTAAATGYTFSNVPAGNTYEVRIASLAGAPSAGAALASVSQALATGWIAVSTSNNGVTAFYSGGSGSPVINLGTVTTDKVNVNFGIEQIPAADAKAFVAPNSAFATHAIPTIGGKYSYSINAASGSLSGSALRSLSGNDPEDCSAGSACNTGRTYRIQSVNANTLLYYNYGAGSVPVSSSTTISNFDPAALTIYGQQGQGFTAPTALGFTYSLVDAAGVASAPATYSLMTAGAPLPIVLRSFTGSVSGCTAALYWETESESNSRQFIVEHCSDGRRFDAVGTVASKDQEGGSTYSMKLGGLGSNNYYRLKMMHLDGSYVYGPVLSLGGGACGSAAIAASPVPATDVVSISGLGATAGSIRIYNSMGTLVAQMEATQPTQSVSIAGYASGSYLLRVMSREGAELGSVRIVKE